MGPFEKLVEAHASVCPHCKSADVDQTGEFDLTDISAEECRHDFRCNSCEGFFQILYAPFRTLKVSRDPY